MRSILLRLLLPVPLVLVSILSFAPPGNAGEPILRIGLRYGSADTMTATFLAEAPSTLAASAYGVSLSASAVGFTIRPLLYGVLTESAPSYAAAASAAATLPSKNGLAAGLANGSAVVLDLPYTTETLAQGAAQTDGTSGAMEIGPWGVLVRGDGSLPTAETDAATLMSQGAVPLALPFFMTNGTWGVLAGLEPTEAAATAALPAVQALFPTAALRTPTGAEGIVADNAGGPAYLVGALSALAFTGTGDPAIAGFASRAYRGSLGLVETPAHLLTVVNSVGMEDYLQGVVPSEVPAAWPAAALEAQAVASRTYALTHIGQFAYAGFDLVPTTEDQVYGGYSAEQPASNAAVQATAGQIITYDGKPIQAYFFADSGGATEDSQNVWSASLPYLQGVDELPGYKPTTWTKTFTAQALAADVSAAGDAIGSVVDMVAQGMDQTFSGRPLSLTIVGTSGSYTVKKDNIRIFLALRSTLFTISTNAEATLLGASGPTTDTSLEGVTILGADGATSVPTSGTLTVDGAVSATTLPVVPTTYTLNGKGNGHGVGMPQDGALYMAQQGYTFEQILEHYYTGVAVSSM